MKSEEGRMKVSGSREQVSGVRCQVSGVGKVVFQLLILISFVCVFGLNSAAGQNAEIVTDTIQRMEFSETGITDNTENSTGTGSADGTGNSAGTVSTDSSGYPVETGSANGTGYTAGTGSADSTGYSMTTNPSDMTGTPAAETDADGNGMEVLCLPGVYLITPDSCNPLGPSEYLTDYVEAGGVYPEPPFTGKKIDPALMDVPYQYARINVDNSETIYLYNTPEEAANSTNPVGSISSGAIRYVSYTDVVDIGSGHYVHSKGRDLWLRASPAAVSTSTLGRTFTKTPEYDFGWIVEGCNPYLEMDYNKGLNTTVYYNREDVVNCYETVETKDTTWFRIGENQWVDRIHFRAAHINTTPPPEIPSDRWIEVDLLEQVVMVYENYELIYACMVATGMKPYYTQPGIFQIYQKNESENMTGSFETDKSDYYWLEDVPFTMYFDKLRAFHGAYWRAWYGYEQSHGCVNMSNGDAHWLYNWANVGEWVYVHDPSGNTPTDPELYQEGGA